MNINEVKNVEIKKNTEEDEKSSYVFQRVLDVPGIGYFKSKILNGLAQAKVIVAFLDSSDKKSVNEVSEYLYDIINSDSFNDDVELIIACNKSDAKFARAKNAIESDLNSVIDNQKLIKQKNNLEDQAEQMGKLFVRRNYLFFNFSFYLDIKSQV